MSQKFLPLKVKGNFALVCIFLGPINAIKVDYFETTTLIIMAKKILV